MFVYVYFLELFFILVLFITNSEQFTWKHSAIAVNKCTVSRSLILHLSRTAAKRGVIMFCFARVGFEGLGISCMSTVSSISISVSISSHSEFELLKSWTSSKTKIVWIKWLSIHRISPYVYYIIIIRDCLCHHYSAY